ncbi:MAG: hypothetical protein HKN99_04270 [Winogradskyella sp.]|nr:hypothetical protein [Winogradskyella sp.]MBT8375741.1 hypothetical protein [Bacteroidia bacterium]NNC45077.1 hypothetical protein [Winogradskyella sp.]NNF85837.1 hypothetical protein [Winogradskyella sp.]NNL82892.1 hypothetical protein [Winogradskyella sp.]
MKTLKFITAIIVMSLFTLTSCQDEIDNENGQNPNTNTANSETANNLRRTAMYDGSFDDFLDGISCSSLVLPVTATVNNQEVTIVSSASYSQVLEILAEFNDDEDTVQLQFPVTVNLRNYTQVVVTNQAQYDEIMAACEAAEDAADDAISCIDIDFPISILTYNLNAEQTGSVVLESQQELYTYMSNFEDDQLFAVNYPITISFDGESTTTITSDAQLNASIVECLAQEDIEEEAEENANALESILVDGLFRVEAFVNAGVDTANTYADYTIDFANDLTVRAENTVNQTAEDVEGTYEVASETEVYLSLQFSGNTSFNLLNNSWEVTNYSETSISLQSTTDAAVTLVLGQL